MSPALAGRFCITSAIKEGSPNIYVPLSMFPASLVPVVGRPQWRSHDQPPAQQEARSLEEGPDLVNMSQCLSILLLCGLEGHLLSSFLLLLLNFVLAVLGLRCYAWAFSSCGVWASPVARHRV